MEDAHVCEPQLSTCEFHDDSASKAGDGDAGGEKKKIVLAGTSLFAVFDGHGGSYAAIYSAEKIVEVITRQPKFIRYAQLLESSGMNNGNGSNSTADDATKGDATEATTSTSTATATTKEQLASQDRALLDLMEGALCDAFLELDRDLYATTQPSPTDDDDDGVGGTHHHNPNLNDESGTTVVVVVLTPRWIVCANAGDSRAVYSKNEGRAVPLSYDHKPDDEEEERRVKEAGGYVSGGRVDGDLAVSRGLGDYRFKSSHHLSQTEQRVSPFPDIIVQNRNAQSDDFLVLACDGIWDVNSNKDCVDIIHEILSEGERDLGLLCEEVIDISLRKGSKDNMTTLIVQLPALKYGTGGGVTARREKLDAELKSLNEDGNHMSNASPEAEQE